jgi:glutathione S-transferase
MEIPSMITLAARKHIMTLYSGTTDPYSHRTRIVLYEKDIEHGDKRTAQRARNTVRDGLTVIAPVFKDQAYILGSEYTLIDCALAPLLWRLPHLHIELPRQAKPLIEYGERLFERKAFKLSLTEAERAMRARGK